MAFRRIHWALFGALGLVLAAQPAYAVSDEERAGARAAANQGADAFDQGKWADAAELFARAEALVHSPIHLSYIAQSEAKLGHWVKAHELYNRILREPLPTPASKAVKDAVATAEREMPKLEAQLPYVTLLVKGADPTTVSVTMDGAPVSNALLGIAYPVDPGAHKVEATAPGMSSGEVPLDSKPAVRSTLELVLKPTAGAAPPLVAPLPAPAQPAQPAQPAATPLQPSPAGQMPAQPTPAPEGADQGKGLRVGGYVALGVGVVGVGVGTMFLLQGKSKQSDADSAFNTCGGKACPPSQQAPVDKLDSDAASARQLSTIGFIAGGVGVAAGITLLVLGKHKEQAPATAYVEPYFGMRSLGLTGAF